MNAKYNVHLGPIFKQLRILKLNNIILHVLFKFGHSLNNDIYHDLC